MSQLDPISVLAVAADWHELMIHAVHPLLSAHPRWSMQTYTPINHTTICLCKVLSPFRETKGRIILKGRSVLRNQNRDLSGKICLANLLI